MQLLLRSYKFFTLVLFVSLHAESFVHPNWRVTHLIQFDVTRKNQSRSLMFSPSELAGDTPHTIRCNVIEKITQLNVFSIRTGGWHTSYSSM